MMTQRCGRYVCKEIHVIHDDWTGAETGEDVVVVGTWRDERAVF